MSLASVKAQAIALLNAGALSTPAFERLAEEYGKAKAKEQAEPPKIPKGGSMKAQKKAVLKGVNGKEVRRSGFGRGAASNWDAFGTTVKTKGKLEDGVYQVKGGELRRMADTNGTGSVCIVYRVAAKSKDAAPAKKAATKPAKKAEAKPVKKDTKPAKKEAPAKKADKKGAKKAKK